MGCGSCGCGPRESADYDPCCEGVSEADLERFGGDAIACPSCGTDVYHDAPLCNACGHAMGDPADTPGGLSSKPWIALATVAVVVGLVAVYVL